MTASGTSTTPSVSVTSATGEFVVDAVGLRTDTNQTITKGIGQTEHYNIASATSGTSNVIGAGSEKVGATSVTMSWTALVSQNWAIVAVPIKPAPTTPTTYIAYASAGPNGTIDPLQQTVNSGSTTTFTVTPITGYTASVLGTCGGSLAGTIYTTNAIIADCTVSATFSPTVAASEYARSITIDFTKVSATTQTDFPVLISGTYPYLAAIPTLGGKVANASGYDVGFYSDAGLTTKLKWETEKYVSTTGEVAYWVKVPLVIARSPYPM